MTTRFPWAKLIILNTPRIRESPIAIKAYTPPCNKPSTMTWRKNISYFILEMSAKITACSTTKNYFLLRVRKSQLALLSFVPRRNREDHLYLHYQLFQVHRR